MTRGLLEERFKLALHSETHEAAVYLMVPGKEGSKLNFVEENTPPESVSGVQIQGNTVSRRAWETWMLATYLGGLPAVRRPVIDKTGLKGQYEFSLRFWDGSAPERPDLFEAVEQQLGLKLVPARAPVESIIIDRLEKPSGN